MPEIKMVVVDDIRYHPEDAPKRAADDGEDKPAEVEHKMRTRKATASKEG